MFLSKFFWKGAWLFQIILRGHLKKVLEIRFSFIKKTYFSQNLFIFQQLNRQNDVDLKKLPNLKLDV